MPYLLSLFFININSLSIIFFFFNDSLIKFNFSLKIFFAFNIFSGLSVDSSKFSNDFNITPKTFSSLCISQYNSSSLFICSVILSILVDSFFSELAGSVELFEL